MSVFLYALRGDKRPGYISGGGGGEGGVRGRGGGRGVGRGFGGGGGGQGEGREQVLGVKSGKVSSVPTDGGIRPQQRQRRFVQARRPP